MGHSYIFRIVRRYNFVDEVGHWVQSHGERVVDYFRRI